MHEMTNADLAKYLDLEESLVAKMDESTRAAYVHMAWVESELKAGRRPHGVLVCGE